MAETAAAAIAFLGIEGNGDVAALPDAFNIRPPAVADAVADGPDASELFKAAVSGCNSSGDCVGIVGNVDRSDDAVGCEFPGQLFGHAHSLDLGQVWRVFDNAVANDAGNGDTDCVQRARIGLCQESDLCGEYLDQLGGGKSA